MIVLKHKLGNVLEVLHENHPLSDFRTGNASALLLELAHQFPDELIVWCSDEMYDNVAWDVIPSLFTSGLEMLSYATHPYLPDSIGYVEDTPFVCPSFDVRYPTWFMSSHVGAVHSNVLKSFGSGGALKDFDYFLNSLAKLVISKGILCYSEPALLKDPSKEKMINLMSRKLLFRFVKEHYRKGWTFMLLLAFWTFERRLPLAAFILSLGHKRKQLGGLKIHNITAKESEVKETVDVLIPTLGRPEHLKMVLEDLSIQQLLPKRVIIIEQHHDLDGNSELDYLKDEWPFDLIHRLIHPPGACNARNIGLDMVESDWVFMADDDIRIPDDFLSSALSFIHGHGVRAATFSCLQQGEEEQVDTVIQWVAFGSGCSIVASEVAKMVKYDLNMEMGYGEDKEYGMQLRRSGVDILYNPNIKLLHLKAPAGGFRKEIPRPWDQAEIQPKPSPTIMYLKLKHATISQLRGYKLKLFFKFYKAQGNKNIFSYYRQFKKAWRSSVSWSLKLKEAL